jgi:hypothetical protein
VTTHCLFQSSHNLKRTVRGRRFPDDDKVKEEVFDWLRNQLNTFLPVALRTLQVAGLNVSRKEGDYIEK